MVRRILILCVVLVLALFYSFTVRKERTAFTRMERRMLHIPTSGLFDKGGYFTVGADDLKHDGWCFPVREGVAFTPAFKHRAEGWYIVAPEKGSEVRAAMRGVVRLVRKTDLGKTIVILHPNGLETVYAHHTRVRVKSGEYVSAGEVIARAGADHGMAYTYFGMMVNGVWVNPSVFLNPDGSLKDRPVKMQIDDKGTIQAIYYRSGEVAEQRPSFDWAQDVGVVDLSRPFSVRERQDVGVPTPGLFAASSSYVLDLSRIDKWCYPLPGAKVISPYGNKRTTHVHTGTDLKTRPNDKIRAVFDGVVRFSGVYSAYGNIVVIRHANGLETCYSHNARNLVKVGEHVKAGDAIATLGRTGRATTEHCHFEVRVNGVPFNSDYIFDHSRQLLKASILTFKKKSSGGISIQAKP